jgi:hypothetical protein
VAVAEEQVGEGEGEEYLVRFVYDHVKHKLFGLQDKDYHKEMKSILRFHIQKTRELLQQGQGRSGQERGSSRSSSSSCWDEYVAFSEARAQERQRVADKEKKEKRKERQRRQREQEAEWQRRQEQKQRERDEQREREEAVSGDASVDGEGGRRKRRRQHQPPPPPPDPELDPDPNPDPQVGWKIDVLWSDDGKWYEGVVAGWRVDRQMHDVNYSDGTTETLDLVGKTRRSVEWRMAAGARGGNSTSNSNSTDGGVDDDNDDEDDEEEEEDEDGVRPVRSKKLRSKKQQGRKKGTSKKAAAMLPYPAMGTMIEVLWQESGQPGVWYPALVREYTSQQAGIHRHTYNT